MAENNEFEPLKADSKRSRIKFLLLFGAVTLWALPTAYFQIFSTFPAYDDEGYLMMTVKQFLGGNVLYDQVYTQYGAVYYFYEWLIHHLTGAPVTHNATGLTTLFVWILTAFLSGIFAFRLTRSALSGAAAYILTFLILFRTAYEPGHPQELCGLLLIIALLLLTGKNAGRIFDLRLGLLGATVALLLFTKINLGIFLGFALAITFVALSAKNRLQRVTLVTLSTLAALLPFILYRKYLAFGWLRLSLLVAVGVSATLFISLLSTEQKIFKIKHYLIAAFGFCLTAAGVFLIVFASGTTPEAFLNGVFLQNLKFGDNFFQPAPIQRFAGLWAAFALLTALAILYLRKIRPGSITKWTIALKLLFGAVVIAASFAGYAYFLNVFLIISFATPFQWILLLNGSAPEKSVRAFMPRAALVLAATLQPLQIFPIAGTQMNYGAFLMLITAVVCCADALAELKIVLPKIYQKRTLQIGFGVFSILILTLYPAYRTLAAYKIFQAQIPLSFRGAERVRLPEQDFAVYNFLTENLKLNCDEFISVPGIYSLNFWANIEPPTTYNATALLTLLDEPRQQAIVEKMRSERRGCAVYNPVLTANGLRGRSPESFPLTRFILENYVRGGQTGDYILLLSRNRLPILTYYAKFSADQPNIIEFSPPQSSEISAWQIFDWRNNRILADSRQSAIALVNEQNQPINAPLAPNSAPAGHTFYLRYTSATDDVSEPKNLLLRVLDSEGKIIASLPFLSN